MARNMCAGADSSAAFSDTDCFTSIREFDGFQGADELDFLEMPSTSTGHAEASVEGEDGDDFLAKIRAELAEQDLDEGLLEADRILEEATRNIEETHKKTVSQAVQRIDANVKKNLVKRRKLNPPAESTTSEDATNEEPKEKLFVTPSPSREGSSSRSNGYRCAMADLEVSDDEDDENTGDPDYQPSTSAAADEEEDNKGEEPAVCFACGKLFKTAKEMRKHINLAHLQKKDLKCKICDRAFVRIHHLKRHMKTHEAPKFFCRLCDAGFVDINNLIIHKGRVHKVNADDKPLSHQDMVKCRRCSKLLKSEEELKRHNYYCKNSLQIQKQRKFEKETKAALSPAMSTISYTSAASSPGTPTRPKLDHSCLECKQKFANRQSMLRHVGRKHPDRLEEAQNTRVYETNEILAYKCSECGKAFAKEEALAFHARRHFLEKAHACPQSGCGKVYQHASELRKHIKRNHEAAAQAEKAEDEGDTEMR
ncbi:hypothetical protein L596_009097 [Steinernema carpocapsae]|uniref:C2H2-type domain-containing protein n=1 Tax=Steinernema carpocapsae TaxID=34508 RepID=A0A4U5PEX3_STECR|nr:hypothetical protein L596_009097 [Steinernema carpocapsae]